MKKGLFMAMAFMFVFAIGMPTALAVEQPEVMDTRTVIQIGEQTVILNEGEEVTVQAEPSILARLLYINDYHAWMSFSSTTVTGKGYVSIKTSGGATTSHITLKITRNGANWASWSGSGGKEFTFTKSQALDYGTYVYQLIAYFTVGSETPSFITSAASATRYP